MKVGEVLIKRFLNFVVVLVVYKDIDVLIGLMDEVGVIKVILLDFYGLEVLRRVIFDVINWYLDWFLGVVVVYLIVVLVDKGLIWSLKL